MHKLKLNPFKYLKNTKYSSSIIYRLQPTKYRLPNTTYHLPSTKSAFTIVELLVVIVVIGILATITIVSYSGITSKATAASLQSDLTGAKTKLQMYQVEYGSYPAAITETPANSRTYCPDPDLSSGKNCFKLSSGNTLASLTPYTATTNSFSLNITNTPSDTTYNITDSTGPVAYVAPPAGPETVTIGTQVWMKYNINVGTMVTGGTVQTTTQKWCYNNLESNCTTFGGLYQWNTAMQGSTTEGAQGICPDGFHVPTDNDWKALETFLGVAPAELDRFGNTTTTQGYDLTVGGYTGFNALASGAFLSDFYYLDSNAYYFTSKQYFPGLILARELDSLGGTIVRNYASPTIGTSIRCIK